ncbi:hypothetical protein ACOSP7_016613 [Xanthoceras sorbifolium]|uniref:Dirigent protein n=1 Tax=Xanthoceras sorbifolium TaxID=99658 RepID=A0ABQ8HIL1_9ROSI|nr:hypothetical protein JRO89_XS10G0138000 [Xanthoceras sorbifolium]
MAKNLSLTSNSKAIKAILFYLFLLVISLKCANSARILTEKDDDGDDLAPVVGPTSSQTAAATTTSSGATVGEDPPELSFFMHDILGGTAPSGRVVSGITASTSNQINGLPFSKRNGGLFPINGGVPLVTTNNGITSKNLPSVAGLNNGASTTNGNSLPFVSAGQLPLQQELIFGMITVIDDELTEGHELGSSVIGKAQGFYLASSLDGSSQTMAFTALFGDEHREDQEHTISFFGVHRMAAAMHESHVAVVGGTGKYENAQGHATIERLHFTDQHITDGVETLLQISVHLTH